MLCNSRSEGSKRLLHRAANVSEGLNGRFILAAALSEGPNGNFLFAATLSEGLNGHFILAAPLSEGRNGTFHHQTQTNNDKTTHHNADHVADNGAPSRCPQPIG